MRRSAKWSIYCLAAVLAASSLMACAKSPTVSETGVSGYEESDGRVKAQVGEKITVDAEFFTQPERESYEVLHAGFDDNMDLDTVLQVLFPENDNLTIGTEYVTTADQSAGMGFSTVSHLISYFDYQKRYSTFLSEMDVDILNERHTHVENLEDVKEIENLKDIDVPGYSREQAISDVYKKLQKMGLSVQEKPYAMYGISNEVIQAYYEAHEENFKHFPNYTMPEITENDSIYCMLWNVEINDTPVVSGNYPSSSSERCAARGGAERGCLVYVVTTKDRIIQLETQNQFKVKSKEDAKAILPLQEILKSVPNYYKDRLLNEQRTIDRISFCYIPVLKEWNEQTGENEFDLIPGWTLDACYEMPGRNGEYWDIIYINAITGEIIQ